MSLQTENRDFPELGTELDKSNYQRFEHPPLDLVTFAHDEVRGFVTPVGTTFRAVARIYCPDIRVVSRLAILFEPMKPSDRDSYNLANVKSKVVAYRCINSKTRIARVGEIVGKNGVPLEFPKADIDGIAFEDETDMPWIDVEADLAFPGYSGTWSLYYHTTSNNKLKTQEWSGYISRVTMSVQSSPGVVRYAFGGG